MNSFNIHLPFKHFPSGLIEIFISLLNRFIFIGVIYLLEFECLFADKTK